MHLPKLKLKNIFVSPDVIPFSTEESRSPGALSKAELKITGMICGL